ncbi:MAG: hypothetical protein JXA46_16125 [Dehalococcoidales bacterium]|nr:hypothetical protein [Dehalococcoidales bacterium]
MLEVNPANYDMRYYKEKMLSFGGLKGVQTMDELPFKINPLMLFKLGKLKKELPKFFNNIPP